MKTKTTLLVLLLAACAWQSSAQPAFNPDGNTLLNGTFYMRQVFYFLSNQGTVDDTINVQGNITFNGAGSYSFAGSVLDSAVSATKASTFTTTGTYVISANGEGYITPIYTTIMYGNIVGLVSQGIFIGSIPGTNGANSLFIAAPLGSTEASNSTLKGSYTGLLHCRVFRSHLSSQLHRPSGRRCALQHERRRAGQHRERHSHHL
jgi:hypothetical protein